MVTIENWRINLFFCQTTDERAHVTGCAPVINDQLPIHVVAVDVSAIAGILIYILTRCVMTFYLRSTWHSMCHFDLQFFDIRFDKHFDIF